MKYGIDSDDYWDEKYDEIIRRNNGYQSARTKHRSYIPTKKFVPSNNYNHTASSKIISPAMKSKVKYQNGVYIPASYSTSDHSYTPIQNKDYFSSLFSSPVSSYTNREKTLECGHTIIYDGILDENLKEQLNEEASIIQYHQPDYIEGFTDDDYKTKLCPIDIVLTKEPKKLDKKDAINYNLILELDYKYRHLEDEIKTQFKDELTNEFLNIDQTDIETEPVTDLYYDSDNSDDSLPYGYHIVNDNDFEDKNVNSTKQVTFSDETITHNYMLEDNEKQNSNSYFNFNFSPLSWLSS